MKVPSCFISMGQQIGPFFIKKEKAMSIFCAPMVKARTKPMALTTFSKIESFGPLNVPI